MKLHNNVVTCTLLDKCQHTSDWCLLLTLSCFYHFVLFVIYHRIQLSLSAEYPIWMILEIPSQSVFSVRLWLRFFARNSSLVCNLERHQKTRAVSEIMFLSFEHLLFFCSICAIRLISWLFSENMNGLCEMFKNL